MANDNDGYPIGWTDADKRKYGNQQRAASGQPPSSMTPAERRLYNAPNEMGGYSKGGKVVARKMVAAKKHAAPPKKAAPAKRGGKR